MSATQSEETVSELGKKIAELAKAFDNRCTMESLEGTQGSSSETGSYHMSPRETLILLLNNMLDKVQGPTRTLIEMVNTARVRLSVMRIIINFNLIANIPDSGSISFNKLASIVGANRLELERVLRFAFSQRIFQEKIPGSGEVSHTELSKAISALTPWIKLVLSPVTILPDLSLPEALESKNSSKAAAELAFKKNFWRVLKSNSKFGEFQDGLRSLSIAQKACLDPVGDLFRWEEQAKALIIDLGGGDGYSAIEGARKNPHLHFIVQDLEENRIRAEQNIPQDLKNRVIFQAHDFFTPQRQIIRHPVTIFMKSILHNWSNDRCVKILRQLLPLLTQEGSRLLVQEYLLSDCAHVRAMDVTMLTLLNSGERTIFDFEALFHEVDKRMRIVKVWDSEEWGTRILEVTVDS
ncbi:uncharacterized protein Z519_12724 [Cladophialophora bantiana CBS 173.52]|uniref:O-methyltransferase C-terminal domain-containing protein n=1 Tax=Cladophialophora bantiana (strain ATCC 10958 / CBS 173.52 / CDC B-1940 / NIH 8579) TaxID=1442370 RepID=A0A0D2HQD7_CLAB1|nr:uncharacterized protein Z519_12724 [Cladophialophora bantiana CBS 173.52]KIW86669.1 hypothetical protein Z519_12724 [Cladophialophora bantiana CBS 173.52]